MHGAFAEDMEAIVPEAQCVDDVTGSDDVETDSVGPSCRCSILADFESFAIRMTSSAIAVTSSRHLTLAAPDNYVLYSDDLFVTISAGSSSDDAFGVENRWSVRVSCVERCRRPADETPADDSRDGTSVTSTIIRRQDGGEHIDVGSHPGQITWIATIPCGEISETGGFIAQLVERQWNGTSIVIGLSSKFNIIDRSLQPSVPNIELRLPITHQVLGSEIPVTLTIDATERSFSTCRQRVVDDDHEPKVVDNHDDSPYSLQLVLFKWNSTVDRSTIERRETVQTIKLTDLSSYSGHTSRVTSPRRLRLAFSCSSVNRPGVYRAELLSADGTLRHRNRRPLVTDGDDVNDDVRLDEAPTVALAVSNRMLVTDLPVDAYSVTVSGSSSSSSAVGTVKSSVFPCVSRHLSVRFTQPMCPGSDDRIRVYEHPTVANDLERRGEDHRRVEKSPAVPISAANSQAMDATAPRISRPMSVDLKKMTLLSERRVKHRHTMVTFDCDIFRQMSLFYCFVYVTVTDSGGDQVMERARACLPTNSSTDDDPLSSASSPDANDPASSTRLKKSNVTVPFLATSSSKQLCRCGCSSTLDEGWIVGSSATIMQRSCSSDAADWSITVSPGHVIRLIFERMKLGRGSSISIYDGGAISEVDSADDLLAWSRGGIIDDDGRSPGNEVTGNTRMPMAEMAREVWSTGNAMRIEYRTSRYPDGVRQPAGRFSDEESLEFSAVYFAVAANSSTEIPAVRPVVATGNDVVPTRSYMPDNVVTLAGIGVCCAVVIASVTFVFRQNLSLRRLRAKQALLTPAAYRAKHVTAPQGKGSLPGEHRRHRKQQRSSRGTGENGAIGDRDNMTDTPPPLPVPPLLTSDQSVVTDGGNNASDMECVDDDGPFQFPVDDCRQSPVIGDRYRSSSAAALLLLHHTGQLSLLPQTSSSSPLPPLTPVSLTDRRYRHRHRRSRHYHQYQQQRSATQPVSPATSWWSAGHGGAGQLSIWDPDGSVQSGSCALPLSVFRPRCSNRRRLMMVNDQKTFDGTPFDGSTCDADDRVAAAAAAVAALGRFYNNPKQKRMINQQQQVHQQHQQYQVETNKSPTSFRLRSPSHFRSQTTDYSVGADGALKMAYRSGNYFSMATADVAINDGGMFPNDCFSPLEKRPPVEGRDSMNGDNVVDLAAAVCAGNATKMSPTLSTSSSATLTDEGEPPRSDANADCCGPNGICSAKAARYIPPSECPVAERRKLVQHSSVSGQMDYQYRKYSDRAGLYSVARVVGHSPHQRSSSLSSLSDIVAAAGDSDMLEFDDDEYDDYYRAADSAAALGRLKPVADDLRVGHDSIDSTSRSCTEGRSRVTTGFGVSSRCETTMDSGS